MYQKNPESLLKVKWNNFPEFVTVVKVDLVMRVEGVVRVVGVVSVVGVDRLSRLTGL